MTTALNDLANFYAGAADRMKHSEGPAVELLRHAPKATATTSQIDPDGEWSVTLFDPGYMSLPHLSDAFHEALNVLVCDAVTVALQVKAGECIRLRYESHQRALEVFDALRARDVPAGIASIPG